MVNSTFLNPNLNLNIFITLSSLSSEIFFLTEPHQSQKLIWPHQGNNSWLKKQASFAYHISIFHFIFQRISVIHIVFKLWWCYAWSYWKFFSNDVPVWNYLALRRFASNFAKNILVSSFDRRRSSNEGCHGKGLEYFLFFGLFWNYYHNCVDFNLYAIKLFGNENPH